MLKSLSLVCLAAILFSGCFGEKKEEKWTAFVYPDKENTKRNIKSPITFTTLEECKKESILQLEQANLSKVGTYKCGLNCEYHEGMKIKICAKMLAATTNDK